MSQPPTFSVLYQYALVGAVAVAVVLVVLLCLRARVLERRRLHNLHPLTALHDLTRKPRLHDAYLDDQSLARAELWHDIMPVSLHPVGSSSPNSTKYLAATPAASALSLSTVALVIAMPSPHSPRSTSPSRVRVVPPSEPTGHAYEDSDTDEPPPLPYLELGLKDVEMPRETLVT
ncbi:hypothetical protein B0H12DRAFT_1238453 [Mycena haematopus]|nr:hypothetical protein B0H12DRAFT_1238453 [Mycena haematopus]